MAEELSTGGGAMARLMDAMSSKDPHDAYRALAAQGRVINEDGVVILTRLDDLVRVTSDRSVRSSMPGMQRPDGNLGSTRPLIPLSIDGPEHTWFRKVLDPLFAPRRVAAIEPEVRAFAGGLVDGFAGDGGVEAYSAYCQPLPSNVFVRLMGLPPEDVDVFMAFEHAIFSRRDGITDPDVIARLQKDAGERMYAYLENELDRREESGDPGPGLVGGFLSSEIAGRRLTRENILDVVYLLLIAGLDTVTSSLSLILYRLARMQDERQALVDDPSLIPAAIEELLRYESPVPAGGRFATEDIVLETGEVVAAGSMVTTLWGLANSDSAVFDDPERVDFHRAENRHLAFASGFHRCLGSHLARMELRVALEEFHRRVPVYRIAEGAEPNVINFGVRAVQNLRLAWD